MKDEATIYLEAAWHGDHLKIGIHEPDDTLWNYEDTPVSMEKIRIRCREIAESLNRKNRRDGGTESVRKIRDAGRMLFSELLSEHVKEKLMATDAEYLILKIDEHLVHIPWELICIGEEFLCQRFSMGRLVESRQKIAGSNRRNLDGRPLDMWILANPEGNLASAYAEGRQIFRNAKQANKEGPLIYSRLDTKITSQRARLEFQNYDLVHFAGHAEYDLEDPGESGWKLTEGNFTADDIHKMAGGAAMPALVFSNACQTARTEAWEGEDGAGGDSFGLANAFLFAGTRHYIGTFWEITDEPGSQFALAFYDCLFSGETVGKAMKEARFALMEEYGPDFAGWTSYLLYGDPRVSYVPRNGEPTESAISEPSVTRKPGPVRGTIRSWYETRLKGSQILSAICLILILGFGVVSAQMYIRHKDGEIGAEMARKHQEETCRLIRELKKEMPVESSPENRTSGPLSMAILYDSIKSAYSQGQERIVSSVIAQQIQKRYPPIRGKGIRLLERKELKVILEELRLMPLVSPEKRLRPKLLNARLILFLEVHESFFSSRVHMRLFDTETTEVISLPEKEVKVGRMASQNMSEHLLETLKTRYNL